MLSSVIRMFVMFGAVSVVIAVGMTQFTDKIDDLTGGQKKARRHQAAATPPRPPARPQPREEAPQYQDTGNTMVFEPDRRGHYLVNVEINGDPVRFLVDTGASMVVLSPGDAERLGFDLHNLSYTGTANTANGQAKYARIVLDRVSLGQIEIDNVQAAIMSQPMNISLLGMTFLKRLPGFEVRDKKLILRY